MGKAPGATKPTKAKQATHARGAKATQTAPSAPTHSRWADDSKRGLVATALAIVVGGVARLVIALTDVSGTVGGWISMEAAITLLAAYITLLGAYAVHTWVLFSRMEPAGLASAIRATTPQTEKARRRQRSRGTSSGAWLQLAAGLALLGVAALIVTDGLRSNPALIAGSLGLVVVAWGQMAVSGTLLLVREDLGSPTGRSLTFPDEGPHRWADFTYLAIQICTTFSSSDVAVTTTRMRRAVTSLAITAFLFNTVIVALLVSVLLSIG